MYVIKHRYIQPITSFRKLRMRSIIYISGINMLLLCSFGPLTSEYILGNKGAEEADIAATTKIHPRYQWSVIFGSRNKYQTYPPNVANALASKRRQTEVPPEISPVLSLPKTRKGHVVLSCLRIGNVKLTHQCLVKHEPLSQCICTSLLTIKYIILNCPAYWAV